LDAWQGVTPLDQGVRPEILDLDLSPRTFFYLTAPPFVQFAKPGFFPGGHSHFPGLLLQLLGGCRESHRAGSQRDSSHF